MNQFDMFGFNIHRHTRFLAGFVVAPYLLYSAKKYNDKLLLIFGLATLFFDSVTLYYTYKEPSKDMCKPMQIGLLFGYVLLGYLLAEINRVKLN